MFVGFLIIVALVIYIWLTEAVHHSSKVDNAFPQNTRCLIIRYSIPLLWTTILPFLALAVYMFVGDIEYADEMTHFAFLIVNWLIISIPFVVIYRRKHTALILDETGLHHHLGLLWLETYDIAWKDIINVRGKTGSHGEHVDIATNRGSKRINTALLEADNRQICDAILRWQAYYTDIAKHL